MKLDILLLTFNQLKDFSCAKPMLDQLFCESFYLQLSYTVNPAESGICS